ncbi:MAG: AAA family ATPase [Micromonosporaceae bacterium]|nr:AAA family ATPase [Micromonosporaceae bacterium]
MAAQVRIELLAQFRVTLDGQTVADDRWPGRRSAELVQLLALNTGGRCPRDRVIDALWGHLDPEAGAANLRKAAHFARKAIGHPEAVVLRAGMVALFPGHDVEVDVDRFESAAEAALRAADRVACAAVAAAYPGDLLPESLYEEWTQARREELRSLHRRLLGASERWERLVELDRTDEAAYRELMRAALRTGARHAAIRWYGRLRMVLEHELGVLPSPETIALYEECVAGLRPAEGAIVGRQVEVAYATSALDAGAHGELGAIVVRGPTGIGKSTLCREIAAIARARTWRCVSVAAGAHAGPYGPLIDVMEQLIIRDRGLLDALPEQTRSVLAELTMLAAPAPPLTGPLSRQQVIGAMRRLLVTAADAGVIVVVVDDAHLADDATTHVLLQLAGVSRAGRIVVVLSYRPERAGEVLAQGVARLDRAGAVVAIDVAPLDRDAAGALVSTASPTPLETSLVARIVDLAAGNPFFLLELARNAAAGQPLGQAPTVWEAIATRFIDLDEQSRAMLQRLAVAGVEHDPAGVLAITGLPEPEAFRLLDAALAAEVLVVAGTRYRFRHDLVRQALVEQVPPHRRAVVHRETAQRLASAGGQPDVIAQHWLAGGRPDEAIDWLLRAAREAVKVGAFSDADRHLDILLRHVPNHADALFLRAEVFEALGDDRAPVAFAAAAQVVDGSRWHDVRARQALALLRVGDPEGAVAALVGVQTQSLEGRLTQALAVAGAAAMGVTDPAMALARVREIRHLAVELGDPVAVIIASWAEAAASHARGDLPSTVQARLRETYALPELAVSVFDGQLCAVEHLLYGGRPYREVIAFAEALRAEAERLGAARGRAFATTFRGEAKMLSGRLDEADADLAEGAELHRAIRGATGESMSLQRRAEVALYRGDRRRAHALLDEALDVARTSNVGFHLYDRIYGTRIAAAADPASAMAALEEAEVAISGSLETCLGCRITLAVPAAIAAARFGDLDRAIRYEAAVEKLTGLHMRQPGWCAALDEVRGHRAVASGDARAAGEHFAAAAAGFRHAGQPLDAERCDRWAATLP